MLVAVRLLGVVALSALSALGVAAPTKDPVSPPGHGGLPSTFRVEVVAKNLTIPWSMVFLPDGRMLFTERHGNLNVLDVSNGLPAVPQPITGVPLVASVEESGLLGIALHPDYAENGWLYLYYTYALPSGVFQNRVERFRLDGDALVDGTIIIDGIPGFPNHDGGRIRFGPDSMLYICTGETGQRARAQDLTFLGGKILRVRDDGSIPFDNPFGSNSPVWTLGHRNPQGIDFDPRSGLLYETEHGPSTGDGPPGGDEINIIDKGLNYGWPLIHHRMTAPGLVSPLLEYTPAVAPSGGSFYTGTKLPFWRDNFFFACLRGRDLHRLVLHPTNRRRVLSDTVLFNGAFGRLRDVITGPDGFLYICTSNRDGRGQPVPDDDRILRIVPNNRGVRSVKPEIVE